ncbi:L-glutamate gamma-semialdehyde dehydrogenase [Oceanobacillus locisalsi]|uniref:L-glutamate gamma-semialdehyde dehydrogenase n=1 Tax=Oceanobacillus locisalsi TaxID=546107 RepID=A0ABW3NH90_9BACI
MVAPYTAEPSTDFQDAKNIEAFENALTYVASELGKDYPLIIGGERITTTDKITSVNPAKHDEVIGTVSKATQNHVDQAMEEAERAFKKWSAWDPGARANVLFRAAAITRRRKHEISAWIVYELGKPWKEADGEVSEAIDFMEYYGRQMIQYKDGVDVKNRPIENNQFTYLPMGVGVTVSPWNFPYAILAGTTVGPMVAGNTILLKPASLTPITGFKFIEILEEAGMPPGVVNFLPGSGGEIGDYLVEHPKTHFVNFTGSKEVGISIYEKAAKVQPGQNFLKKTAIEMGGKDTIIVDREADLDLAAESIVQSAFGFSGQKCASCSRVVAHEDVYDTVLEKVRILTEELTVGVPESVDIYMGPVCDVGAFDKISNYLEVGKQESRLVFGGTSDKEKGYFIKPTIFADADPESRIMQEEIFGPVVAFTKGTSIDELIDIANNTDYGLTGSIISNNRTNLEKARKEFHVGNLYFNRGCTAAIVGYHPFGGFKLSGTDSKAGGPGYILHFMEPKTVSEQF